MRRLRAAVRDIMSMRDWPVHIAIAVISVLLRIIERRDT